MPSQSLLSLEDGLSEINDLREASPRAKRLPSSVAVSRAIGRASVVILSSHLEGYVDSLNLEATTAVNGSGVAGERLPESLRLLHSRERLGTIAGTTWDSNNRARHVEDFVHLEGWLWSTGTNGQLDPDQLVAWMSAPTPRRLVRYFRYWGVDDIFSRITRKSSTRAELWIRIQELVDKRNSIAHGDIATAATKADVASYARAVRTFATRADKVLASELTSLCGAAPW